MTVKAQINKEHSTDISSLKPSLVQLQERKVLYHYTVFDLCDVTDKSQISFEIQAYYGKFKGKIIARVDEVQKFGIICPKLGSGKAFESRQHHASCKSYDDSVWIFGGMRNVGGKEVFLNDLFKVSNEDSNSQPLWKDKTPAKGDRPAPRYGHTMICVYDYLIVFGG